MAVTKVAGHGEGTLLLAQQRSAPPAHIRLPRKCFDCGEWELFRGKITELLSRHHHYHCSEYSPGFAAGLISDMKVFADKAGQWASQTPMPSGNYAFRECKKRGSDTESYLKKFGWPGS